MKTKEGKSHLGDGESTIHKDDVMKQFNDGKDVQQSIIKAFNQFLQCDKGRYDSTRRYKLDCVYCILWLWLALGCNKEVKDFQQGLTIV